MFATALSCFHPYSSNCRLLAKRAQLEAEGKELSELDGQLGVPNSLRVEEWTKSAEELEKRFALCSKFKVIAEKSKVSLVNYN